MIQRRLALTIVFVSIWSADVQALDAQSLVEHVKKSIANAAAGHSKLTQDVLQLQGMSSPKVRHFLNH